MIHSRPRQRRLSMAESLLLSAVSICRHKYKRVEPFFYIFLGNKSFAFPVLAIPKVAVIVC